MLFNDNPTTILIPFKDVSLFFKFYTLRNTDKPSSVGMECMQLSVVKDGETVFTNNYPLKTLNFINHNIRLPRDESVKISIPNVVGFGQTSVKIISFQIELTPDVFLHLENYNSMLEFNYYEMAKIVSSRFNQITQSYYVDSSNGESIIEQKNFTVSTLFIKSIKEYNKYLYERLVKTKLWVDFKTEREIDEFWIADNITKQINVSHFSKEEGAKFMLKMMAMAMVDKKRKEKK
jgi:hypothetical protein